MLINFIAEERRIKEAREPLKVVKPSMIIDKVSIVICEMSNVSHTPINPALKPPNPFNNATI